MGVLSIKEFNQRSTSGKNSLEKTYQNKSLTAGPVFSLTNLNAAKLYCQSLGTIQNETMCLIVEEENFFRIWSGNNLDSPENNNNTQVENQESNDASLPLEASFIEVCQKKLAINIGPIAKVICKKTLAKKPNLARVEFVEILAKKISDPDLAQEFKQDLLD